MRQQTRMSRPRVSSSVENQTRSKLTTHTGMMHPNCCEQEWSLNCRVFREQIVPDLISAINRTPAKPIDIVAAPLPIGATILEGVFEALIHPISCICRKGDRSLDIEVHRIQESKIQWLGDGVQRIEKSNSASIIASLRCREKSLAVVFSTAESSHVADFGSRWRLKMRTSWCFGCSNNIWTC